VKHSTAILVFVCFGSLFFFCYSPALFQDRQFGYRDAGHYYYPLHQRVQEEWNQGRWPLWEPEENAGAPLLGNPTAAVLYPGKLVFAVLPYPWAARTYIVIHTAIAFITMLVLLRSWGISWAGSGLGTLSYTFGAPVLFQSSNVIFMVGAAWLPLGIHAVDRWVRLGRRWAIWELAAVLALQVLGGDPQAAYLLGIAGAGYALGLAWTRAHAGKQSIRAERASGREASEWPFSFALAPIVVIVIWAALTVVMGFILPKLRPPHQVPPTPPVPWMPWMPIAVPMVWGLAGLGFLYFYYWRGKGWRRPLGAMWLGLLTAALLAASLSAAQLLPVIEFTQQTARAAGAGAHELYPFSIEPWRLVEMVWPGFYGSQFEGNGFWADVLRVPGVYAQLWVPSLYLGGLTVILGASAFSFRKGPAWRVWLSALAVVSLVAALGMYTSPIWTARAAVALSHSPALEHLAADLGPVDHVVEPPIRLDGFLRDGDGSIYWWLATFLPGFRQFRFPGKLFTFVSLALGGLAAAAWDRICSTRARRLIGATGVLLVVSLCVLAGVALARAPILAALKSAATPTVFGPLDSTKGYAAIIASLAHCSIVLALGLVLFVQAPFRPRLAGAAALFLTTLDLAAANTRYVMTVEQSLFEREPSLLKIIRKAENDYKHTAPGPFRVHRMPAWNPPGWQIRGSADRVHDFVAWGRDTIQPKFGINFGIEYTHTIGVGELDDYQWFFVAFGRTVTDPGLARTLEIEVGKQVVYSPRRAYDMWNTRYFVVPYFTNGWGDHTRGSAAFIFESEQVYPEVDRFSGPNAKEESNKWIAAQDFRVLRNNQEYPRSWVVHKARSIKPFDRLSTDTRAAGMQEILYAQDMIWYDPGLAVFDPREVAWVTAADLAQIMPLLSGRRAGQSETVRVSYPDPQRAELDVTLDSSGLVILGDVYYPGWQLTVDGRPAPIYRVNGVMRGAVVSAGPHRLVYSFAPGSFQIGLVGSVLGLAAWLLWGVFCVFRPTDPVLGQGIAASTQTPPHPDSQLIENPEAKS
jgi:hypothetical protein